MITLKWPLARVTHGVAVQVAFQSEGTQTGRAVEGSNVGVCLLALAQVTFVSKSLGTDVARVRSFFQMQGAVPFKKGFQSEGHRAAGAFEWSFSRVDAVVLLEPGSMWKGLTAVGALVGHPSTAPNTFTAVQSQFRCQSHLADDQVQHFHFGGRPGHPCPMYHFLWVPFHHVADSSNEHYRRRYY